MEHIYLDDYSKDDIIEHHIMTDDNIIEAVNNDKPKISLKSDFNSKGEKIVVFSINIPFKKDALTIDILINDDLYKNIGKYF
jgi:hypothetical protein